MKALLVVMMVLTGWLASSAVLADVVSFAWDNDIVFQQDGGYTNGARFSWLGELKNQDSCPECRAVTLGQKLDWLPGFSERSDYALSVSVEQLMITPSDISVATAQYDDIPYAGLLRSEWLLVGRSKRGLTGYGLTIGVTGRASGAESAQRRIHQMTGSEPPQGWHHQLPQQAVLGVVAGHARELWRGQLAGLDTVLVGAAGLQASHWEGLADVSFYGGIGRSMPSNFLPTFDATGTSASTVGVAKTSGTAWMFYVGLKSQGFGWSYLERESRKAGYDFRHENVVGALNGGIAVKHNRLMGVLSVQSTTRYTQLSDNIRFGSFALIYRVR